jgi:aconitate hydratase
MAKGYVKLVDSFVYGSSKKLKFFSLPALEQLCIGPVSKLPVCIRIVLESLLRNFDHHVIKESDIHSLANWTPQAVRTSDIPFIVARVLLQDMTGVPLGVDLAAMRSACKSLGRDVNLIEPSVPVDLVIDHSVQVDFAGSIDSLRKNMELEFSRNQERYEFLKWCQKTFKNFRVVPPGVGICHQVNLEFLAPGVHIRDEVVFPDSLVGTDSHTTMINGLGVVGWGVGGIEAESAMLGQPVYFLTPDVVGVELANSLSEGVTATDLVLHITQVLRSANVVGKFIEFHGIGARELTVPDRATISNMAPEYGATMGFFPIDEHTVNYLLSTGRREESVEIFESYYRAQRLFGIPLEGECNYSSLIKIDLADIKPSVAGPKRPQDKIEIKDVKSTFLTSLKTPIKLGGFAKEPNQDVTSTTSVIEDSARLVNGSVVIAAITSCTNTSNPSVMLAAGLLAKKAVELGLKVPKYVKCSLAPGSRIVSEYLIEAGLQSYLDQLGFNLVGYGCTTCIGNSGPLEDKIEEHIVKQDLVVASVLSGNRNFEARVHSSVKANFLMSPPLVVAYALAGRVDIDLYNEPLGVSKDGKEIFFKDLWPSSSEIKTTLANSLKKDSFKRLYDLESLDNPEWQRIAAKETATYNWRADSTYIQEPPYFNNFNLTPKPITDILNARAFAIFGDSITTDHISPAGAIKADSPAGRYLLGLGVQKSDFNTYGSRRGNHNVMIRGTFANVRIKNQLIPDTEGPFTLHQPSKEKMTFFEASERYRAEEQSLIIIAGSEYGTGSSRDWAAKGTMLLGVGAVIADSFERIHRSNLIGMGVLPFEFAEGVSSKSLNLSGDELFSIKGLQNGLAPKQSFSLVIINTSGESKAVPVILRIDTNKEVDYYVYGGILKYVLAELLR